jgi:hypothetical protein
MDAVRQKRKQQQQQLLPNGVWRNTIFGEVKIGISQANCIKMQTHNLNILIHVT